MQKIREKAKSDQNKACEELMKSVVGEIQKEFLITLEKEISRASIFYQQLTTNIIREVNSILRNRD